MVFTCTCGISHGWGNQILTPKR